jgi:hypothetical protein
VQDDEGRGGIMGDEMTRQEMGFGGWELQISGHKGPLNERFWRAGAPHSG